MSQTPTITQAEIDRQMTYCTQILTLNNQIETQPLAFVETFGCQQNESDSERLRGYLRLMGYGFTDSADDAQIVILNTCAIREHAEMRVLGNVGALTHTKRKNPQQIICVCGCMMQQGHMAEKIKKSFRHVDLVFGPQVLWRFPEFISRLMNERSRIFEIPQEDGSIAEGIPVVRQDKIKAWVSIMFGCNNFCTYCIVPYVRGRERSRLVDDILNEVRQLVAEGYREITLLGQNVNSYGKDLDIPLDFSDLLEQVNDIAGDFLIRFMTSHPKDATQKLFETMAKCEKVAPMIHLPFQCGNDRVLEAMNRRYTRAQYLDEVRRLKALIPHVVLTSDVIVGFPGETTEEFEDTLTVLEEVEFDALFTFIFSPRKGTPAAEMDDPMSNEQKHVNFERLLEVQNEISLRRHESYVGQTMRCLIPVWTHTRKPSRPPERSNGAHRTVLRGENHRGNHLGTQR